MGVAITELLSGKEIEIDNLRGKTIAVDGPLFLYQFLTTIRSRDGSLLTNSKGDITSHLVGLFSRTINLMQKGINLIFVFDGKHPDLKRRVHEQRNNLKLKADKKYLEAKGKEDKDEMRKYAARTSRLSRDMIDESKKLISYLGLPVVEAPSEGEAQAAYMVKEGKAYAVASQDADSLMFGAPKLLKNLSITGRRKKGKAMGNYTINPEIIELSYNLNNLGIDQDQLIILSMIIGTDYNPGGIKGLGPKNALKLVKKYKSDFETLFNEVKWNDQFDYPWTEVYYLIKQIPTTNKYELEWRNIDHDKLYHFLVDKYEFSEERVINNLKNIENQLSRNQQKSLGDF